MSQWMPDRILNDLLDQISSRKFPYKGRNKKKVNWAAYNRARIECLENILYLIKTSVDNVELIELRNRGQGRPPKHSAKDKAKAILLAELFQADERTASGLVSLFREKLGIEEEMSPRTIGRAYYDPDVRYILQELLKQSNEYIKGKAKSDYELILGLDYYNTSIDINADLHLGPGYHTLIIENQGTVNNRVVISITRS